MPISLPPCIYLHRSLMAISKVLLLIILACSNLVRDDNGIEASQVSQSDRTGYHFQPPKNWINDPNGPMYYKGIYHLFYQYNPKAAIWGNIVWAHSVSKDLISWMPLDIAISPTEPFDINGCWSGSSTILPGNKPAIIYTGDDQKNRQVQNLAYPKNLSDPYLREWIKPSYNPVISPDKGINASFFRDPTTAWFNKGQWNILVGNQNGTKGQALLYKSTDFVKWTKAKSPLFTSPKTRMWECPDFYPVFKNGIEGAETSEMGSHVKHVLKVSMNDHDYYMIGDYISNKDRFVPDTNFSDQSKRIRYDYGNFYASKTFFDKGKNRRILWGWVNESDTQELDIAKGWSGIQAIPRKVWLDKTGEQLLEWPVEELESLRGPEVHMSNLPLVKGGLIEVQGITAEQADVEVIFKLPKLENLETFDPSWVDPQQLCRKRSASVEGSLGPFGLLTLASEKLEEYTAVFFRVFKAQKKHVVLVCSGGERSSLKTELWKPTFGSFVNVDLDDGKLSLRSLIDHSVVESFAARGKTCIISRVYPSLTIEKNAHLYVFNNGTETVTIKKLSAWSMNTPPNELRRKKIM